MLIPDALKTLLTYRLEGCQNLKALDQLSSTSASNLSIDQLKESSSLPFSRETLQTYIYYRIHMNNKCNQLKGGIHK